MKRFWLSVCALMLAVLFWTFPVFAANTRTDGDWISRLELKYGDELPGYASELYNWLIAESSLDDGALVAMKEGEHGVEKNTNKNNGQTTWRYLVYSKENIDVSHLSALSSQEKFAYLRDEYCQPAQELSMQVVNAFRRDYPEVNWLSDSVRMSTSSSIKGTTATVRVYLTLRVEDADSSVLYDIRTTDNPDHDAVIRRADEVLSASGALDKATAAEQIAALNTWLTENNAYAYADEYGSIHRDPMTALMGNTGEYGPVCEGYAKAFKILCDRLEIPCVLVSGIADNGSGVPEAHMWNAVMLGDNKWYGVDVTWNDPVVVGLEKEAKSGYEQETYLLVGSETMADHASANYVDGDHTEAFADAPELQKQDYSGTENCSHPALKNGTRECASCGALMEASVSDRGTVGYYPQFQEALAAFDVASDSAQLTVLCSVSTDKTIILRESQRLYTKNLNGSKSELSFTDGAKIIVPAGANAELNGFFRTDSEGYLVEVYGMLTYRNTEIYNDGGSVFLIGEGGDLTQRGGGINAKENAVTLAHPSARYEFAGGGINANADKGYVIRILFDFAPVPNMTAPVAMFSGSMNSRTVTVAVSDDAAWMDDMYPLIYLGNKKIRMVSADSENVTVKTVNRTVYAGKTAPVHVEPEIENKLPADAAVIGGSITVESTPMADSLSQILASFPKLELDFSGIFGAIGTELKNILLSSDLFAEILDAAAAADKTDESLEIRTDNGSAELNAIVLQQINDKAGAEGNTGDVQLSLDTEKKEENLSAAQKEAVQGMPVYKVVEVSLTVGGEDIHQFNSTGSATVRVPFTLPEGVNPSSLVVLYVDEESGDVEKIPARYEDGFVIWETTHFSDFIISYAAADYLLGDANHDGKADSSDAVAILRNLAGYDVPNFDEVTADFNGDDKADSSDAVAILRKLAGY